MKRFLVLGVGNAQVDLLNYLQGIFELHSCSFIRKGRGITLSDFFEVIDIKDVESIRNYCLKNRIDFVYSIGSDLAMPTISKVSELLTLPHFTSYQTSVSCNSKNIFRDKLKNCYGKVNFQILSSIKHDSLALPFPLIVKPADSQGQRGVCLVNSDEEFQAAFYEAKKCSQNGLIIAEEYINGPEISVNVFVQNSKIVFLLISDRISWPGSKGGAIHMHKLPCSLNSTTQENTIKLVKSVLKSLNIENGPAYFQIKIKNNEPKLIEVTPRLDGCHMWRLIKMATGIDLLDITIKYLTTGKLYDIFNPFIKEEWTLEFFCAPPNTIIDTEKFEKRENSMYHEFFYSNGEVVNEINGYMEKCGYQIYRG